MNKLLMVASIIVLSVSMCAAQVAPSAYNTWRTKGTSAADTCVNSKADTTAWLAVGASNLVSVKYTFADRASISKVTIQHKARTDGTAAGTDTLAAFSTSVDNTTKSFEYMLRNPDLDLIDVVDGYFRLITTFAGSGNDSGKKFYIDIKYKP